MLIKKKISVNGEFAKKGEDIKKNDVVTILDEGQTMEGQYGTQHIFKIKTKNGDKVQPFNQTTLNGLVDAFGEDTSKWVGKEVKIEVVKQNVQGKFVDVYYFGAIGWELGENGFYPVGTDSVHEEDLPEFDL